MTTCLDDLNQSLQDIAGGIGDIEPGSQSINVSLEQTASSQAVAAAQAVSQSISIAVANAEAMAIALNVVNIDLRIEQTAIVNMILPPVSASEPPPVIDYPPEKTGVTGTVATDDDDGQACQLLHMYIQGLIYLLEKFSGIGDPIFKLSSAIYFYLQLNVKAAVALGAFIPITQPAFAAIASVLVSLSDLVDSPSAALGEAAGILTTDEDTLACLIWDVVNTGGDTFDMAEAAYNQIDNYEVEFAVRGLLKLFFSPSTMAAALYLPEYWAPPATSHNCNCAP